jgi:hypothetical protein
VAKRSIVYIDGFNLYYGVLRGAPYKWLDLEAYFTRLRQDDRIQHIRYLTARVARAARQRQDAYLRAPGGYDDNTGRHEFVMVREGLLKERSRALRSQAASELTWPIHNI